MLRLYFLPELALQPPFYSRYIIARKNKNYPLGFTTLSICSYNLRMHWSDITISSLKSHSIFNATYVPDAINWNILSKLETDNKFHVIPATREEEAIGIAAGIYAGGQRAAMFMQSSGFGNTVNALTQLLVAYRIPVPLFIGMRGGLGEFNEVQVPSARSIPSILDTLNIQHYAPLHVDDVEKYVNGAIELSYASRMPVAVLWYSQLVGAKRVTS